MQPNVSVAHGETSVAIVILRDLCGKSPSLFLLIALSSAVNFRSEL